MPDPKRSEASKRGWVTRKANEQAMQNKVVQLVTNAQNTTKARSNFLSQFTGLEYTSPKHNHYYDYGYPAQGSLVFKSFYDMFRRNGLAYGAVRLTVEKTWETLPELLETPADKSETVQEKALAQHLRKIRFWQHITDADRRGMVGCYSALILRIGDGKQFREPVDGVSNGIEAIREVIPAWEGQLTVSSWVTDETDENYGQPQMYQFNEANVAGTQNKTRSFEVHPDRVLILSDSGTVHDRSALEPGYNALLDCEKISGAGGEGFWKNAKAAPVMKVDKEVNLAKMAQAMGVEKQADLFDAISDQVDDYNTGIDKNLLLQGIEVTSHDVALMSPEHFFMTSLQIFCASMSMPMKILIGMQTGERASQEDQSQWAKTNMARRDMRIIPFLESFLERLKQFGMINDVDWTVHWDSLMEDSPAEKIGFAKQMAEINQTMSATQPPFTHDEVRERVGYEPLSPKDMIDPDEGDDPDHADDPNGDNADD